jgi:hypothetical protein
MEIILIVFIFGLAVLAWVPAMRAHDQSEAWRLLKQSRGLLIALCLFTASAVSQIVFLICVGSNLFDLSYSHQFAAFGAPAYTLALVITLVSTRAARSFGVGISSFAGLFLWLFLVMLH